MERKLSTQYSRALFCGGLTQSNVQSNIPNDVTFVHRTDFIILLQIIKNATFVKNANIVKV